MRAQASIELLLVFLAATAFLLAMAPLIRDVGGLARHAAVSKQQEASFERLYGDMREAFVLGDGSRLRRDGSFAANTTLRTLPGGVLAMFFNDSYGEDNFTRALGFVPALPDGAFEKGAYLFAVLNDGGEVRLEITRRTTA
ncbi:Uncharacterised protein [Candidatus Norongarragalina meridionalis]|nr:Uncharacterised protein [Candidatus Norongarragalina meridionalis]